MKHAKPFVQLVVLLSAAAMGCAGSLDENADYNASATPARVTGSGGRTADSASLQSAGGGGSASAASSWRDAGAPVSESNRAAAGAEASQDEDAGVPVWSAAGRGAGGAGGSMAAGSTASAASAGRAGSAAAGSGGAAAASGCDFRALVMQKCAGASCHGGASSATGLDLTSAMLAGRVQGRHGSGSCTDKLLVDVDDPAQSKLYLKVSGTSCGVKMPLGGSLTPSEQACVLTWIEGL